MTAPVAEAPGAAPTTAGAGATRARTGSRAPTTAHDDGPGTALSPDAEPLAPELLTVVPAPAPDQHVVDLGGRVAGGLTARQARWSVDGGDVLLTGAAPFVDLSGRAGFRSDGTLDGTVAMHAAVRLLGLRVAEAEWTVGGWSPELPLAAPAVALRGSTLSIDLSPVEGTVALHPLEGLSTTRTPTTATIALPDGALPPGTPLTPRVVELFRGLRGWDVTALRVHPDVAVEQAPAFVTNTDLFFAPGRYGVDSPETAALLDAAVRAALTGLLGAMEPTPPAPPPQPAPDQSPAPAADTAPVPATVPDTPPVDARPGDVAPAADVTGGAAAPAGIGAEGVAVEGEAVEGAAAEGAAEGAAAEEAPAAEGEAPVAEVELIMPPAPAVPGPAAEARIGSVGGAARSSARAARDLPPAEDTIADARGAVTEPAAETAARAQEGLAEALGARPAPSPEIVELCERIRTAIREHRPVDEDELLETNPAGEADQAGATVAGSVEGQVDQVEAGYADLANPPAGEPALAPTDPAVPPTSSPGMGVSAASAAPDPIPAANLSLDADVAATDQRISGAGIDNRVTQAIPAAPFSTVRDSRGELGELAEQTPAELAAEQEAAIATAQTDMAALQTQATQALLAARAGTVGDVTGGQGGMVTTEQQTRESVGARAQGIFTVAQGQVTTMLEPLTRTAMARWTTGLARVSQEFNASLDAVQRWIDERHSGVGGFVVGLGDAVFGLPDWVIEEYDRAERAFGDGICDLLLGISTEVNGVVAAAQAIIAQARTDIDGALTAMEAEFPEWVAQERARFSGMLDGLSARVTEAQTSFVREVSTAATTAVAEAQAAVEERRDVARGVVGRIVAAIEAFIDDPVTAIINGLLNLVGIPPAAFWSLVAKIQQVVSDIADDPETFINNMTAGVRLGFEQFFDNFGLHVLKGFWEWLFSGLRTPIPMPTEFSARSLFTFALQLMGITWPRVREILVRHVGEENVEIVEAAWQLISVLIERGPEGLVEMVKEQLTPEVIVQTILEAAVEYLVQTLIEQVVARAVMLFNPVGAIAQAIELIYQVCAWIFRNAARIFRFVEAVVNGMADVVAGNTGGLANAVEKALASLIPPVIDFLAGLMHMGDLPEKVAEVITTLQARVYQVMERVIGFLAERGRALLAAMGLGGEEDDDDDGAGGDDELGTTVRFTAAGESHRVWVDAAGDDATVMVSSVPMSIESKIAEWQGKLAGGDPTNADLHQEATEKLAQLSTESAAADTEADALVTHHTSTASDDAQATARPSDNELESRERTIAGLLDRLFTIFGEGDRVANLGMIREGLPSQGTQHAEEVLTSWKEQYIDVWEVAPIGGARTKLWTAGSYQSSAFVPTEVLGAGRHHVALLPFFDEPHDSADTGVFRTYALRRLGSPVRPPYFRSMGNRVAATLRTDALATLAGTGDSMLQRDVRRLRYQPGATDFGGFAPRPDTPVSVLVQGVVVGNPLLPLETFVGGGTVGGVAYEEFRAELLRDQANRTWLADRLRGLTDADHEWLPVSIAYEVLHHAVTTGRDDLRTGMGWVSLLRSLRTPTIGVMWNIVSQPVIVPGAPAPQEGPGVDPRAHVGGLSLDRYRLVQDGLTTGTGQFHDALRDFFRTHRSMHPAAWVDALLAHLPTIMWTGSNVPIPPELRNRDIGVFYARAPGTFVAGMTVAQVMAEQQQRWEQIVTAFRAAKAGIR